LSREAGHKALPPFGWLVGSQLGRQGLSWTLPGLETAPWEPAIGVRGSRRQPQPAGTSAQSTPNWSGKRPEQYFFASEAARRPDGLASLPFGTVTLLHDDSWSSPGWGYHDGLKPRRETFERAAQRAAR